MTDEQSDVKLFLKKLASDAEHLNKLKFKNLMSLESNIYHIIWAYLRRYQFRCFSRFSIK